ncbi:protein FD-like [Carica papaya]|uniref:protein FD-like n=1 Tax=Carica papaya TaxID=3649 RepID=UPI000B8CC7E4|nr:protein FD-like [Carica papaya]
MWATGRNDKEISCSPSKSSSSSPSSPPSQIQNQSSTKKSMEEVWKDINLSSLTTENLNTNDHPCFPVPATLVLQDFLARPLIDKHPSASSRRSSYLLLEAASSGSPSSTPPTILSLGSGSADFKYLEISNDCRRQNHQVIQSHRVNDNVTSFFDSPHVSTSHALGSSSVFPSSFCRKRVQLRDNDDDDRRHKRMIKNRESAARSRARKQAYTQELEIEIANLLEENARLRKQQEELLAANTQVPKKLSLHRTLTAPF